MSEPNTSRRRAALGALAAAGLVSCGAPLRPDAPEARWPQDSPPPLPREFRGAWVATVSNIDWPSRTGLVADVQRAEMLTLLDRARDIGLNAIVLQVRPAGDAIFPSTLEPWSEVLSGEQGKATDPAFDPLALWVAEAHQRGLELHAWFNPYRAKHSSGKSPLVAQHLAMRQPDAVKAYGDQLWMDPGHPAAMQQTLAVVRDVVSRYDVDSVHIDDYFYPYPVQGADGVEQPFPDAPQFQRYVEGGGALNVVDWRRDNVNRLVRALHRITHATKPWVRVGISPFGIGQPALRPAGIQGFSQYDKLFADVELWLDKGWLDYLAPQLYWPLDRPAQAFEPLLDYWLAQNTAGRHVWPGLFTSSVGRATNPWPAAEVLNQVAAVRSRASSRRPATGHIHFSMAALLQDRDGLATQLRSGPYAALAVPPATPWLDVAAPEPPLLSAAGGLLQATLPGGEPAQRWAVWRKASPASAWRLELRPAPWRAVPAHPGERVVVSALGRSGLESERTALQMPM